MFRESSVKGSYVRWALRILFPRIPGAPQNRVSTAIVHRHDPARLTLSRYSFNQRARRYSRKELHTPDCWDFLIRSGRRLDKKTLISGDRSSSRTEDLLVPRMLADSRLESRKI